MELLLCILSLCLWTCSDCLADNQTSIENSVFSSPHTFLPILLRCKRWLLIIYKKFSLSGSDLTSRNWRARPQDLWWMVDKSKLDFEYYLPIFAHALFESKYPFDIIARDGILQMLDAAKDRVLGVLPEVVLGIKKALNTDIPNVIMNSCAVIQKLTTLTPLVALALIKHYRMLLVPTFIKYKTAGIVYKEGEIDYGQRKRSLGKVIDQTLDLLDRSGGPDAYVEIKYAVPTFQSAYHNA